MAAADNLDLVTTPAVGTLLNLPAGTLQGETARVQTVRLVSMAGADGVHTFTDALLDTNGALVVALHSGSMASGTTILTPKFAKIAASSSGDNTLVAAVTAKKIRVLAYTFIANGSVNAKFQSGASGTDLTGLKYCVVNSGLVAPFNPVGWFETVAGALLNLNLSGATAVGGELTYVEI